jgi:hypothetical protein
VNTETGRIYPPDELAARHAAALRDANAKVVPAAFKRELDDPQQAEFERGLAKGTIAPAVALTGQQAARLFQDLDVVACEPTDRGALWRFPGGLVLAFDAEGPLDAAWALSIEPPAAGTVTGRSC